MYETFFLVLEKYSHYFFFLWQLLYLNTHTHTHTDVCVINPSFNLSVYLPYVNLLLGWWVDAEGTWPTKSYTAST